MRQYISTLALCALVLLGLGSCNKAREAEYDGPSRAVTFRARLGGDTRTGLALKFVPNWLNTNCEENVRFFETYRNYVDESSSVTMTTGVDGNYEVAYFTVAFENYFVMPPSEVQTRAVSNTYSYTAVVARRTSGKKFFVPSTQKPQEATLIDPDADFLVGSSGETFPDSMTGEQIDLDFRRPVAISRLALMNLEGAVVKRVEIVSADDLTGEAAYADIDFDAATVAFSGGSKTLTLDYGTSGVAIPAEGIFNAYFVSLTGAKKIMSISVTTDAGSFAKAFGSGKTLTFKVPDFKSIAVNMADAGNPSNLEDQNLAFVKGGETVTSDSFDLYTGGVYESPTLTGVAGGATVTYGTGDPSVATVSASGVVSIVGAGQTTVTATASQTSTHKAGYAEYTLTVTDSTPASAQETTFNFVESTLTEGVYVIAGYESAGLYACLFPTVIPSSWEDSSHNAYSGDVFGHYLVEGVSNTASTFTTSDPQIVSRTVKLIASGSGWKVRIPSTGKYLAEPTKDYEIRFTDDADAAAVFTAGSVSSGQRSFRTAGGYHFYHSGSAAGFTLRSRTTSNLRFFRKAGKTQTVQFTPQSATIDLALPSSFIAPVLSGNKVNQVTYRSSNTAIAEVSASGAITAHAKGQVTITADVAGDEVYEPATAEYTLTVINSNATYNYYTPVTSSADFDVEDTFVIASGNKVFKPVRSGSAYVESAANVVEGSLSGNRLELDTDLAVCHVFFEANGEYYFIRTAEGYLYVSNNNLGAEDGPTSNRTVGVTFSGGKVSIKRTDYSHYLAFESYFRRAGSDSGNLTLYKLEDNRPAQASMAYSQSEATYDLNPDAGNPQLPTLSGVASGSVVSYESANPSVAEVNTMGIVTPKGKGSTVITATAVHDNYKKTKVSYTLTVINSSVQNLYYQKVTSTSDLPTQTSATGSYIFVYESGSMVYVFKAICDGTPTGDGKSSTGHVELTKTGSGSTKASRKSQGISSTATIDACAVALAHHASATSWYIKPASLGTYWIRLNNDSENFTRILAMTSPGFGCTFTFDGTTGNNLTVSRTDGGRTAYLTFNETAQCFEATDSPDARVALYRLAE